MRRFGLALLLLVPADLATAQTSRLLDAIQLIDPGLTATVVSSTALGDCNWPAGDIRNYACIAPTSTTGALYVLADGSLILHDIDGITTPSGCGSGTIYNQRMARVMPDNSVTEPFRFRNQACLECSGSTCTQQQSASANYWPDITEGVLHLFVDYQIRDSTGQVVLYSEKGQITISGFPKLFDTLLTFTPGGQLSALMPAHPDGFRSADSVQVWTGDVRTMPDWSQAQPLTCAAAVNPSPGQVVTVTDTLPDPALGHGRYYLTASQSGPERRLGRQYVNGAFAARSPETLPVCQ